MLLINFSISQPTEFISFLKDCIMKIIYYRNEIIFVDFIDHSFLIIPTVFLSALLYILGAGGRQIVPRFLLMEFYRSVNLFLQPIKLHEISIMMRNWNYDIIQLYLFTQLYNVSDVS